MPGDPAGAQVHRSTCPCVPPTASMPGSNPRVSSHGTTHATRARWWRGFNTRFPQKRIELCKVSALDEPQDTDWPADHDGSAKVALLGMERSHAAWLELAAQRLGVSGQIEPFIADLIWLSDELERVFPNARAFVRPGFDEPDEVAKLLAAEGSRS